MMGGKTLWTTLATTGAVSVTLAAALSFNGVLTGTDSGDLEAQSNGAPTASLAVAENEFARSPELPDSVLRRRGLAEAAGVQVVVIDAGHGGRDHGCEGVTEGTPEKEIALDLALGLGELLRERHPDMQVVYTRDRDVFVPLHQRARVANRAQADLFLSLHCNALASTPAVRGSESYVMGLHTAQHNLDVAKRENAAIHLEKEGNHEYYDFDPESPAGHITLSMFQHAHLEQSLALASGIETALGARDGHRSRGVKQAGFLVLRETSMPSVLVEAGYLTNPTEEAFLTDSEGQAATVEALYRGVEAYMIQRSGEIGAAQSLLASTDQTMDGMSIESEVAESKDLMRLLSLSEAEEQPVSEAEEQPFSQTVTSEPVLDAGVETKETIDTEITDNSDVLAKAGNEPLSVASATPAPPAVHPEHQAASTNSGKSYYVQLSASQTALSLAGKKWVGLSYPIRTIEEGGFYKYQAGPFGNAKDAAATKRILRKGAFPDAFTIAYRGEEKLP